MLTPPSTEGRGKKVTFRRKKQKRLPRRLIESVPADWERWDAAAKAAGLNWSEWARRALTAAAAGLLLLGCGGSAEHGPERLETTPGSPVALCWTGCLFVEGPGLVVNNEPTEGCFWSSSTEQVCVHVETPTAAVLLVDRESCRESCR